MSITPRTWPEEAITSPRETLTSPGKLAYWMISSTTPEPGTTRLWPGLSLPSEKRGGAEPMDRDGLVKRRLKEPLRPWHLSVDIHAIIAKSLDLDSIYNCIQTCHRMQHCYQRIAYHEAAMRGILVLDWVTRMPSLSIHHEKAATTYLECGGGAELLPL